MLEALVHQCKDPGRFFEVWWLSLLKEKEAYPKNGTMCSGMLALSSGFGCPSVHIKAIKL